MFNAMIIPYCRDGIGIGNARPGFIPEFPTWRHLSFFNKYAARLSYLSSLGVPGITCAVYMPMRDLWAGGQRAKDFEVRFDNLIHALEKLHCPVDLMDDDFLETAELSGGVLSTGTAKYNTIILLKGADIPLKSRQILDTFVKAGGKIIYDDELSRVKPCANITNEKIAVYKRILENGVLYFLYNEGTKDETFNVSFVEEGNLYEIDARRGELFYPKTTNVTLTSGEERIYFITDSQFDAKATSLYTQGELVIKNVEMKKSSELEIGNLYFKKHECDEGFTKGKFGDWCKFYNEGFSGEVIYKAEFDFDTIPEKIEIDLGCVKYSCDITLNDIPLGMLCFTPFTCTAGGKILKKHNTLLVRVANTPANQFVSATFLDEFPPNIIGPYHKIAKQFESESLESGILNSIKIRW